MNIGDIEIPIVHTIEDLNEAEGEDIKALNDLQVIPVKHEPSVQTITILGYLNEEMHSENLSLAEQKSEVKTLKNREAEENNIVHNEYRGHLMIEDIDFEDTGDEAIVDEVIIEARYLPWPKHLPESEP